MTKFISTMNIYLIFISKAFALLCSVSYNQTETKVKTFAAQNTCVPLPDLFVSLRRR